MWLGAAEAGGNGDALILAVWAFLGIVVTTLGTIAVQGLKGRSERTTASPPSPLDNASLLQLMREHGALFQRADDSDERDEMQDRRIDDIERHLDRNDPEWRTR